MEWIQNARQDLSALTVSLSELFTLLSKPATPSGQIRDKFDQIIRLNAHVQSYKPYIESYTRQKQQLLDIDEKLCQSNATLAKIFDEIDILDLTITQELQKWPYTSASAVRTPFDVISPSIGQDHTNIDLDHHTTINPKVPIDDVIVMARRNAHYRIAFKPSDPNAPIGMAPPTYQSHLTRSLSELEKDIHLINIHGQ